MERRAKRGVQLRQIADSTKISMRFLLAIEQEQFDQLPGGIFLRSYLRQYAAAIGCDPAELIEAATAADDPAPQPGSSESRQG